MQIIDISSKVGYPETRFDCIGLTVTPVAEAARNVVVLRVEPGGRIGRHPAVGIQVFAVVAGSGTVSGDDGVVQPISEGQAAVFRPGELHETRSEGGLTAVVSEGANLVVLQPAT